MRELWADPAYRKRLVDGQRRAQASPELQALRATNLGRARADPDFCGRHAARLRELWSDPDWRRRTLDSRRRAAIARGEVGVDWARELLAAVEADETPSQVADRLGVKPSVVRCQAHRRGVRLKRSSTAAAGPTPEAS